MAIIKCKMCGGDLVLNPGQSVAECEYCGSLQTVPSVDNEKKLTLFARANRLRSACEFDKAAGIYETIVADFPEEAESYWGLVLCKYGIEYVDDPGTGKKIPTCHRSSFESVLDDSNLEQALENADAVARKVYREEARQIEELRKGIIAVSSREEPYDVFICYKETDPSGNRTLDSVLAQDIYDALAEKGYRVFFSRITLEDKLGQEYEPYIFAALNSAKIMLAVGTDYEFYNAVWVKNEWSRFLKLMTQDKTKHLIPCYKGIDAYDMPKEFGKLQAQDLGKLGAMQDLLRGIQKLLPKQKQEPIRETVQSTANASTAPLLRRMSLFLEEGKWTEADNYAERVLDQDPECAEAYLGKLMAEQKIHAKTDLAAAESDLKTNSNYKNALRFAAPDLRAYLESAAKNVEAKIKSAQEKERVYQTGMALLKNIVTAPDHLKAAREFEKILDYKNSRELRDQSLRHYQTHVEGILDSHMKKALDGTKPVEERMKAVREAIDWLDKERDHLPNASKLREEARRLQTQLLKLEQEEEQARQARKEDERKERIYQAGEEILRSTSMVTDYLGAAREFEKILGYRDAREKRDRCLKANEMHILSKVTSCISKAEDTRQTAQERLKSAKNAKEWLDEEGKYLSNESELRKKTEDLLTQLQELERKEEEERYQAMLNIARESHDLEAMREARAYFEAKGDYRDSKALAGHCAARIADLEQQAEEARIAEELRQKELRKQEQKEEEERIRKKMITIIAVILTVIVLFIALIVSTAVRNQKEAFQEALALYEAGEYAQAAEQFKQLSSEEAQQYYQDSLEALEEQKAEEERQAQLAAEQAELEVRQAADAVAAEAAALEESGDIIGAAMLYGTLEEYPEYMEKSYELWNQFARRKTIVAGGGNTLAVKNDGTMYRVGYSSYGQLLVTDWTQVIAVDADSKYSFYTMGLRKDGTVLLAGELQSQIETARQWTGIVDIAAGFDFVMGLKADGTVILTEREEYQPPIDVSGWTEIVDIAVGYGNVFGLRANGTVVAAGENDDGECDVSSWRDIVAIEAHGDAAVGLKADGRLVFAGKQPVLEHIRNWTEIEEISMDHWAMGRKKDGTVIVANLADPSEYNISAVWGWRDIVSISAGHYHMIGLRSDGTLVAAGSNYNGQCNVENWTNIRMPG